MLAITGQMFLQWLIPSNSSLPPGTERGDILFHEDCLPSKLGDWSLTRFTPADTVASERVWASSWYYVSDFGGAVVSFDQAGYTGWHELSDCYVATGWKHVSRKIIQLEDNDWPCVASIFEKPSGQQALVVFSLFFDDGMGVVPPNYDLSQPDNGNRGILDRFGDRMSDLHPSHQRQDPTRQCQVFVVGRQIGDTLTKEVIDLHVSTRAKFLAYWRQETARPEQQSNSETSS